MSYYSTCPLCNASLDPGERCSDCAWPYRRTEVAAPNAPTNSQKEKSPTDASR